MLNKNKNIVVEQAEQEYILFDTEKNTIFILNRTAYELWTRFESKSKKEVISEFIDTLDMKSVEIIGINTIQNECENIIEDFIEKELLEV